MIFLGGGGGLPPGPLAALLAVGVAVLLAFAVVLGLRAGLEAGWRGLHRLWARRGRR